MRGTEIKPGLAGVRLSIENNAGWLLVGGGLASLVLFALIPAFRDVSGAGFVVWAALFALSMAALTTGAVTLFTRTLDRSGIADTGYDPDAQINVLFRLGYLFIAAVVFFSITLLINPAYFAASEQTANGDAHSRSHRAMAIVQGCDYSVPSKESIGRAPASNVAPSEDGGFSFQVERRPAAMPAGAHCGHLPPQWVLSIGGNILDCHIQGTCAVAASAESAEKPDAAAVLDEIVSQAQSHCEVKHGSDLAVLLDQEQAKVRRFRAQIRFNSDLARDVDILRLAGSATEVSSEELKKSNKDSRKGIEEAQQCVAYLKSAVQRFDAATELDRKKVLLPNNVQGAPIVGGVVVPIYFLAIALLGACIGMLRKLPEYQRRSAEYYKNNYDPNKHGSEDDKLPLEKAEARDYLIFQSIQVVFAPAIALIAYSFVKPNDASTAALLAFAAGYSSEIFLMIIRQLSDRLLGLGFSKAKYSATGKPGTGLVGKRVRFLRAVDTYGPGSIGTIVAEMAGRVEVRGELDEHRTQRVAVLKDKSLSSFQVLPVSGVGEG